MYEIEEKSRSDDVILVTEEFSREPHPRRCILMSLLFHLICIIIFAAAWKVAPQLFKGSRPHGVNLISCKAPSTIYVNKTNALIAPAREAVTYESVLFMNDLDDWNVYKGEPSPELETAWDDILKCKLFPQRKASTLLTIPRPQSSHSIYPPPKTYQLYPDSHHQRHIHQQPSRQP
jgi:hypothetical protein